MPKKQDVAAEVAEPNQADLDNNEMNALLSQLVESKYWEAILRYNRIVDSNTLNALASLDPFKEPTMVARSQGIRMGLYNLEQTALRENKERKELENTNT